MLCGEVGKEAQPARIWSRSSPRHTAGSARVVAEMTRPSGSFHDALRRDPSCVIRMCDARTVSSPVAGDAISPPLAGPVASVGAVAPSGAGRQGKAEIFFRVPLIGFCGRNLVAKAEHEAYSESTPSGCVNGE